MRGPLGGGMLGGGAGSSFARSVRGTIASEAIVRLSIAASPLGRSVPVGPQGVRQVANNWFRNTVKFEKETANDGTIYYRHNGHAQIVVQTNTAFDGSFVVYRVPTNPTAGSNGISIFVDGALVLTVGESTANLNMLEAVPVTLAGIRGVHTIAIVEGDADPGTFTTALQIAGAIVPQPGVSRQYSVFGDSVGLGNFASPLALGWALLMRANSRFDSTTILGRSGLALSTVVLDQTTNINTIIASLIGTTENVVAACLVLNDYISSVASTTAATFQTSYGNFLDALHAAAVTAAIPGFRVKLHTCTPNGFGSTPNDKGSTIAQFNAAILAVQAARTSFVDLINVETAFGPEGLEPDGIHPNTLGHQLNYQSVVAQT